MPVEAGGVEPRVAPRQERVFRIDASVVCLPRAPLPRPGSVAALHGVVDSEAIVIAGRVEVLEKADDRPPLAMMHEVREVMAELVPVGAVVAGVQERVRPLVRAELATGGMRSKRAELLVVEPANRVLGASEPERRGGFRHPPEPDPPV